jgi:hypothetical protein
MANDVMVPTGNRKALRPGLIVYGQPDLGYFNWKTLEAMATSGSYFHLRYKTGTALYVKNNAGSGRSTNSHFHQ